MRGPGSCWGQNLCLLVFQGREERGSSKMRTISLKLGPEDCICRLWSQKKVRASYKRSLGTGFLSGRPESGRSLRKPAPRIACEALAFSDTRACEFYSVPSSSRIDPNEDDLRGTWHWGDELWTLALMKARVLMQYLDGMSLCSVSSSHQNIRLKIEWKIIVCIEIFK